MTVSVAEKATAFSAGDNRACSDGGNRKDKHSSCKKVGVPLRQDSYTMEIDKGRNCYACGGFGYISRHCRNRERGRPMEERRVEYSGGRIEEIFDNLNNLKGGRESRTPQLDSQNKYSVLAMIINADTPASEEKVRKTEGRTLRKVMVKIGLERIDTQEGVTVKALLDSGVTRLVMSSEFAKKQGFKLKKLERPINIRNVDGSFNKEGPIENMVEVNIYYQGYRKRMEINVIRRQKWLVILEMLWLAYHNLEIDWRIGEVKMMRYTEECGKQWRLMQGKSGWEKKKKEEAKKEAGKRREEENEKGENNRSKESSRGMGNMG